MENSIIEPDKGGYPFKIKYVIQVMFGIFIFILAKFLLKEDFFPFFKWWFVLLLLGIIFLPMTQKLFRFFHDNGYLFSKTVGLALTGYLMWFLSSLRIMKFNSLSCVIAGLLFLCINAFLFIKTKEEAKNSMVTPDKITAMITEELLFLFLFLIWTYIRGFKPEAYGTEKFMDYGFMTIMMRGDYMPPKDLWFAGSTINYYYVGQYMAAFMTKLSLCTVNVGYNLMLMTLAAFAFVLPLSLIYNVTQNFLEDYTIKYKRTPVFAGLLSGAGVCFAGNMHFTLFYWIVPILRNLLGIKSDDDSHYWFPDSTRYIGYNPDTKDKTIHEFPSYSFILGDLHAHVINIIFVLTVLGILFAWMLYRKKQRNMIGQEEKSHKKRLWKEILNPYILLIGFFIGLFHTTNFWDFPIYYVVAGAVILFSNLVDYGMDIALNEDGRYRLSQKPFWITAFQGITVIIVAKLTALPFTLNFDQISTKIQISYAHTPFYQLIILWGLPITLVLGLFIELIQKFNQKSKEPQTLESGELKINESNHSNLIIKFLAGLNISELFILTLGLCGIGLVLIPELVYVKDIYSGDYKRANTMFKLTYQAFILFGTSAGFIFLKFIRERRFRWQIKFVIFTLILFLSSLWYSKVSIGAWYGNIFNTAGYKGLDAAAYLKTQMPDDFKAINWMNENIKGTPVILEANGDSYSDYERVSVATGLPTVLGWYVHEWLWRGNTEVIDKRAADIQNIYTSSDKELVKSLIDKYQIEYIYVGKCEMEKYETVNDTLLKSLGDVVFSIPAANDKTYATYVIHIEPKG